MAMIGETFEHSEEITGCVVSTRAKGDRISIWTKHADKKEACEAIG